MRAPLAALAVVAVTACGARPASEPSIGLPRLGGAEAPPPRSVSKGAFDGCSGTFTSVIGWTFVCDTTSVVTREGDDVEALLRSARESMRGAFSGLVEEKRDEVRVGDAPRKGLELSLRTSKKHLVAVGTAAVLEAEGRPPRVVACLANADDASQARCRQQLDELSTLAYAELPPPGVRLRPRPVPAIAERPVVEPPDCHLAANDRAGLLDCGDMVLGWSEPSDPRTIPAERDATIEDTTRKMQAESPRAPPPKRTNRACHIEGVVATCSVVKWPDVTLTLGAAPVRGHSILAWCLARDGSTSPICRDSVDTGASGPAAASIPLHGR